MRATSSAVFTLLAAARIALGQGTLEGRSPDGRPLPDALRLLEEGAMVRIDQQFAATTLHQTYENMSGGRIEGSFLLRTGGARVEGFAYWNGAQKIVGEVFERDTARRVYEEVTGLGRDPGLLEEVGEGSFAFRIFPIEPGERKLVEVRFGQRMAQAGSAIDFHLPLASPSASVTVEIQDTRPIAEVHSATHRITIERRDGRVKVRAGGPMGTPAVFSLRYTVVERPFSVSALVHRDPGEDAYVMLQMTAPRADADRASPKDVTLVIDRSGSMEGEPIAQALRSAELIVQRLRPADRLNVLAFDDGVDRLYRAPQQVSEKVRAEALAFLSRVRAGGGTDLAGALSEALAALGNGDSPDVILFLTDGQSDQQAVLRAARRDQKDARVFTIGLGPGVAKPVLSRLAAMKRGRFTFIESPQTIVPRIERLFEEIESPLLLDISVEAAGATLMDGYPRTTPDLVTGEQMVFFGRLIGTGSVELRVHGNLGGQKVVYATEVRIPEKAERPWVGRLWAQARAAELLEEIALSGEQEEQRDEVVTLALAYNFVTPYTSFLAIPESELTEASRATLESAREQKRKILAAHPDAAALSRSAMPPGDPVLSVLAPKDAVQVTAYFPFGLIKDLRWDDHSERWKVRFLVPKQVRDGVYEARVVVLRKDGAIEMFTAPYTVDSAEPDFEVEAIAEAGGVRLHVTMAEAAREVRAALVSDPDVRIDLATTDHVRFEGLLPLPAGSHRVRIVVADLARNEADDTLSVEAR